MFHNLPNGGGKRLFLEMSVALANYGNRVDLFSPLSTLNFFSRPPLRKNAKFKYFDLQWAIPKTPIEYLRYILSGDYEKLCMNLSKKIDKEGYDWVILGGDWLTQTPILANYLSTPSICIAHELKREFYEKTEWGLARSIKQSIWKFFIRKIKELEVKSLKKGKIIIVNSLFSFRNFQKILGNTSNNMKIIYPFINSSFIKNSKIKTKKENFFLSVGSFSFLKGYDFLIRALSIIPKSLRPPLFLVGSNGPHFRNILKLADKFDLEYETYHSISDSKLRNLYRSAKAFLYFSRNEPFGLSPLEALCMGCKIIAVNEGGFVEIVRKSNNCTLIPRKENILAQEVINYIKNPTLNKDEKFKNEIITKHNVNTYIKELLNLMRK